MSQVCRPIPWCVAVQTSVCYGSFPDNDNEHMPRRTPYAIVNGFRAVC